LRPGTHAHSVVDLGHSDVLPSALDLELLNCNLDRLLLGVGDDSAKAMKPSHLSLQERRRGAGVMERACRVADRIAQEVARRYLEPRLEPVFHADSLPIKSTYQRAIISFQFGRTSTRSDGPR
jgi:hypothetical protein